MNIYDMDLYLILYLIFAVAPISIVLHEFGHAFAARVVNADDIIISIGKGKQCKVIGFNRIQLIFHTVFFLGGLAESRRTEPYKKGELVWIAISGPITNALIAFLIYMLNEMYPNNYLQLFFSFNIWLAVVNIIPLKVKEKNTDGYMIMKLIFWRSSKEKRKLK